MKGYRIRRIHPVSLPKSQKNKANSPAQRGPKRLDTIQLSLSLWDASVDSGSGTRPSLPARLQDAKMHGKDLSPPRKGGVFLGASCAERLGDISL